jgi:hypothetical protein
VKTHAAVRYRVAKKSTLRYRSASRIFQRARELADEVSQQNIVDSISVTHTGRLLKKTIYSRIGTGTG